MGFGKTLLRSSSVLGVGVQNIKLPIGLLPGVSQGLQAFLFRKSGTTGPGTGFCPRSTGLRTAGGAENPTHVLWVGGGVAARRRESLLGQDWVAPSPRPLRCSSLVVTAKNAQLSTQLALCANHP